MKILLIHGGENSCPGGVNKTVSETAKNLSLMGHEVVLIQENPFNLSEKDFIDGYNVIRVKSRFGKYLYGLNPALYRYVKKNFRKFNPDIVHIHGYHTLLSAEMVNVIQQVDENVPIVFSPHFGNFSHDTFAGKYFWGIYNRFIGSKFIKRPDAIIAASTFEANNINKFLAVPLEKIVIIPPGVDQINFHRHAKSKVLNLLYVGYLIELKGVQYILRAISELVNKYDVNICFKIVGEGPYKKDLELLAEKLKINQYIKWEGFVSPLKHEKLLEIYREADIFLLLSKSENYGIVVPEALAMGTPAIVTKRTALKEFLDEPGCFGVDYPPEPEEVARLIIYIYKNHVKVGPFSDKIRSWDKVAGDYEKLYSNFLEVI